MRRMTIALAAVALLVGSAGISAQAPSLAGKWTLVPPPDAAGGGGGGGRGRGGFGAQFCGMECTITQDAKALTITRAGQGGAEIKTVYNLDGSESKNSMTFGENTFTSTSVAKVDAGKLVITTKQDMQGNMITSTTTLSLDAGNLKVERTGPGREGAPMTTTQTYKKS